MKKALLTLSLIACAGLFSQLDAQILYLEDFDGIPGPTAGGAGTYTFAPGMLLRNVDNLTPAASVSYVNEAWERREDFANNVADSAAFSTSWYSPAATANDFMWTPAIGPLPGNCVLSWNAVTYDASYRDGYEVRIMTVAPTGGTGVIGNQLTSSTVLFTTTAENTTWTARTASLSAYAGQTVYIGFRNNSNDKFLLLIDDIKVEVQVNIDAQVLSIDTANYTIEPTTQRTADVISGVVRNNGLNTLNNVQLKLNIYDGTMALVNTQSSPALATLAPNATATLTVGSVTPPATPDFYTYEYVVLQTNGTDQVPSNDTLYRGILVDQNIYARDDGNVVGGLGIGAGNGGYIGQQFQVVNPGKVDSVLIYVTRGYTGRRYACVIWDMVGNVPNTIVATTDTLLYPDDSARVYMLPMDNGPFTIGTGMYAVTMVEFSADSTIALGTTNTIFRNNTTWINWPTNPFAAWANSEDFGAAFAKSYVIRPHFQDICFGFTAAATSVSATCGSCTDGSATATSTNGAGPYTYMWMPSGGTGATANGLAPGTYTVTITDANGCSTTASVTVGNSCTSFNASVTASTAATCGTCPDGDATVSTTNGVGPYTYSWSPSGQTTATATGLMPGGYTVTVTDASGCSDTAMVNVTFTTGLNTLGTNGSVDLYPNPSNGSFNVQINLISATGVDIEIYNALGQRVIAEHHAAYTGGVRPFFIETAGAYTVKITTTEGVRVIPIMINN